ncbi:hypothetical protein [Rhizobium rhizogenes]|uniref:hypothetical protein n=1 Tax=Rhizobium rhizogenes TaxID=359 RepID=UPI00157234A7|nr:hypothetical protein [Rhizobium rhizogenes]NTF46352.1 hypothetical protein [Rhizobium rhizogenes]
MKTETSFRLTGAKSALTSTAQQSSTPQTPSASVQGTEGAASVSTGVTAGSNDQSSTAQATIVKSWTSGGVAGTGRDRVTIEAAYPATKNTKTGAISLGADSFKLTVTDLNTGVSSTINPYLFSNTEWTEIPLPADAGDAEKFEVRGNVKIDVQTSGKMMRVRFHVNTASQLSDIGYIFVLDIPENTKFTDVSQSEPSS